MARLSLEELQAMLEETRAAFRAFAKDVATDPWIDGRLRTKAKRLEEALTPKATPSERLKSILDGKGDPAAPKLSNRRQAAKATAAKRKGT